MDKKSKSFWMYTIILFTVALVLVLLSLFMTDYKQANENYESRVQSIQNENLALKNENATLKKENEGLWVQVNTFNAEKTEILEKEEQYANAVEAIYIADGYCGEGNFQKAKETLDTIDPTILKEQIKGRYNKVKTEIDANID